MAKTDSHYVTKISLMQFKPINTLGNVYAGEYNSQTRFYVWVDPKTHNLYEIRTETKSLFCYGYPEQNANWRWHSKSLVYRVAECVMTVDVFEKLVVDIENENWHNTPHQR